MPSSLLLLLGGAFLLAPHSTQPIFGGGQVSPGPSGGNGTFGQAISITVTPLIYSTAYYLAFSNKSVVNGSYSGTAGAFDNASTTDNQPQNSYRTGTYAWVVDGSTSAVSEPPSVSISAGSEVEVVNQISIPAYTSGTATATSSGEDCFQTLSLSNSASSPTAVWQSNSDAGYVQNGPATVTWQLSQTGSQYLFTFSGPVMQYALSTTGTSGINNNGFAALASYSDAFGWSLTFN